MPDITMCSTKDCKKKNECYRYLAKPSQLQSYSVLDITGACNTENNYEMFISCEVKFVRKDDNNA